MCLGTSAVMGGEPRVEMEREVTGCCALDGGVSDDPNCPTAYRFISLTNYTKTPCEKSRVLHPNITKMKRNLFKVNVAKQWD